MRCDYCGEYIDFGRSFSMYIDKNEKHTFDNAKCLLRWLANELDIEVRVRI